MKKTKLIHKVSSTKTRVWVICGTDLYPVRCTNLNRSRQKSLGDTKNKIMKSIVQYSYDVSFSNYKKLANNKAMYELYIQQPMNFCMHMREKNMPGHWLGYQPGTACHLLQVPIDLLYNTPDAEEMQSVVHGPSSLLQLPAKMDTNKITTK